MKVKNVYSIIIFLALALVGLSAPANAQSGLSCSDPIVLTTDYAESITGACERWYIANTFDLPMAIDFYPTNSNSEAPNLELDFGCTPGEYEDSILCSLFCISNNVYMPMPHKETPSMSNDNQGKPRYHVEFGELYRNLLLQQGIDYNIPVFIKVIYHGSGSLKMAPDAFNNCMDGHKFMHLGDTVHVQAKDKERHVIVPYVQWQYDSIRYVWQGTTPCTFAVGNKCDFDPMNAQDSRIIDGGPSSPNNPIQPGGQFKVSSALLMRYVSNQKEYPNDAGMYFAKFYSEEPGIMKIEKIPGPAPEADATLLKYGQETNVRHNDTTALYAIPDSWIKAMQFTTPTSRIFRMYIGATPDFYTKDAIATYQFDRTEEGHQLSLLASDLASIWSHKISDSHYVYIRFECSENTTILPTLWSSSACTEKATRIEASKSFDVKEKSSVIYRLYYPDWKGGDMTIAWTGAQNNCPFFIADTCEVPNSNISPVFYTDKAPKKGSITIPMATVDSWESKVDPDGYLYIRFYSTVKGKITVTTSAPKEEDPLCNSVDSALKVTAWDFYEWRGTKYTKSGDYFKDGNVDPETTCVDTFFTLQLTIHTTTYITVEETGCDSIIYNNKKYIKSGEYKDTVIAANGNRTITTLKFTVNHSTKSEETIFACESYEWNGTTYTESGDYPITLTNAEGCDSTVTLHLTIHAAHENTDTTAVVWDSIVWYGKTYKTSGEYPIQLSSATGCEWTHTLLLTVHTTSYDQYAETNCDSIIYRNKRYTESGEYKDTVIAEDGNRTITTLSLTIGKTTYKDLSVAVFEPYTSPSGKIYTESGEYTDTITNLAGCDSIVSLHLTIYQVTYDTIEPMKDCDRIVYNGKTYTQSGEYRDTTIAGDDNLTIHILTLTIGHTTYGEESVYKKGSYTSPRGITYTESGDYTEKVTNASGCDSIITLHITIGEAIFDTVYFCRGYNREHEEEVNEILIRRYLPYTYEAPSTFDYREGMLLEINGQQMLVDFLRAESNLYNHYVGGLTPIESIAWSLRTQGAGTYTPITVEAEPQWINVGTIAVQILFRCGETYNDALPMGLDDASMAQHPIKRIENGQVVIIRGNAVYTPMGVKISGLED